MTTNVLSKFSNAFNDLKNIQAILVRLRENGKQSAFPPAYWEYEPTCGSPLDSSVGRWMSIGISPIAATSACFLGRRRRTDLMRMRSQFCIN